MRRRGRARGPVFAARAVERRAVARHRRHGKAARRRTVADRARRQRRRQIARPARRAALCLVRRGRRAGRGDLARDADAQRRCGRMRQDHARHRRARLRSRRRRAATPGSLWPIRASWNRATENLFSAWIEKLFDAPLDQEPSWPALYNVLRDKSRNMLFNSLGLGEDEIPMALKPDCTDMVYFLRAYFAFKMGLPFGYSRCSRGARQAAEVLPVVQHRSMPRRRSKAGSAGIVRPIFAGRRRCDAVRRGAHAGDRRQHRFLYRAADAGRAAPRHHLRRSLRARADAGAARAAERRRGGRLPRRRRRARRLGHAQAFLARQFPVRARSDARAAPASSASGRSCAARTATCGG